MGIKCSEDRTASPRHHPRVPGCPHPQPSSCRLPTLVEICLSWRLLLSSSAGSDPTFPRHRHHQQNSFQKILAWIKIRGALLMTNILQSSLTPNNQGPKSTEDQAKSCK